ncbi:Sulfatase-modifying factor 2 [Durusdinium trenchii]|uniref:Sulfatase-modifying factor 2 n=2 Tax=Durusdinium trenchii TaxID=1381693 RepID=A0ABP0LMH6_9DINO
MSSSSDSDDERLFQDVSHRLNAARTPLIAALVVEGLFCFLMTRWMWEDGGETLLFRGKWNVLFDSDVSALIFTVWVTYGISVIARLITLRMSFKSLMARKSGRCLTVAYMFFGTMNWLIFLTTYYVAHDAASTISRTRKVNMELIEQESTQFSDSHGAVFSREVNRCLVHNDWNYTACDVHVKTACTKPYDPTASYPNGDCVATVWLDWAQCCVSETVSLDKPKVTFFSREISVSILFMLVKWMAILLVGWVLRHGFHAAGLGSKSFSQGAYLDILDIVIFSENLNEGQIRYPIYGFDNGGKPCLKSCSLYYALYVTFAVAYVSALLAQFLHTLCAPKPDDDADDDDGRGFIPVDSNQNGSEKSQVMEGQLVLVNEDDEQDESYFDCSPSALGLGTRAGRAVRTRPGMYKVTFVDGRQPQEKEVPLRSIQPATDARFHRIVKMGEELIHTHVTEAQEGCRGWLDLKQLQKGNRCERFERKASVLDAFRSMITLQLPFLIWRLWFDKFSVDVVEFAGRTMFIAKNAIWALLDLLTILTCGNDQASINGWRPMSTAHSASESQFGKVWVGPTGMFAWLASIFGSMRMDDIKSCQTVLKNHHEWLLKEQADAPKGERAIYDEKIEEAEQKMAIQEEKAQYSFP